MSIFNVISLLGGLAMFLYGMTMMGDGLKESASGTLKVAMEKLTSNPFKSFLLGVSMTAIIQSSTATIVITAGLVGAGIIALRQSLGIVIGANVGTTVTGQIIRLLDLNSGGVQFLEFFKPSTLAPLALIIGIILIMGVKFRGSDKLGKILIGFGILFSGLLNMTNAVNSLADSGIVEQMFSALGDNPVIGYVIGAAVAFVLQSSSASIGILQAFSTTGQLTFSAIYSVLLGIYLGDCVTTALVINLGSKTEAKRVGMVHILFNLSESVLILTVVTIVHKLGLLDALWDSTIRSGGIANTNTVFNLSCALALFPMLGVYEKLSYRIYRDKKAPEQAADTLIASLNPVFFSSPALAFARCYDLLNEMLRMARANIDRAFDLITAYDAATAAQIADDEEQIDTMADRLGNYLGQLSGHITAPEHIEILNNYYSVNSEFERLGDHASNIAETASDLHEAGAHFSADAIAELNVLRELITTILDHSGQAFQKRDVVAARHIEPLEEVVDDMVGVLKDNHLRRLRAGTCSVYAGIEFLNILTEIERISDLCSNVGIATIARVQPEIMHRVHDYISMLHAGRDEAFNREYTEAHERYFRLLTAALPPESPEAT